MQAPERSPRKKVTVCQYPNRVSSLGIATHVIIQMCAASKRSHKSEHPLGIEGCDNTEADSQSPTKVLDTLSKQARGEE